MKENFDDLLIEKDLKSKVYQEIESAKKTTPTKKIKNFNDLSAKEMFSKHAQWKVFNRRNYTNSIINGIQAEAFLSPQETSYEQVVAHKKDCFLANHLFIEFYRFS